LADAYGSVPITFFTRSSNGAMPVFGAIVPITCARRTSYAAK
jgi:hypothetical protein